MHRILLFYKYVTVKDPEALRLWLLERAQAYTLTGRILVAEEGINGTVEGTSDNAEAFAQELLAHELFGDLQIKQSSGMGDAFPKLSVKVRREIVGTRFPKEIDPRVKTGTRLAPETLRRWYEEGKDFAIVDMRNDYEYESGHFRNSVNPGLANSRDLPQALPKLAHLKDKTVLTVCTGGVRCEKMSAYLLAHGFTDVYQLENGMHGYMQMYPGQDFEGTLYTFDARKVMDFGGERTVVGRCRFCESPAETYVNCANDFCHLQFLVCPSCNGPKSLLCGARC